MVLAVDFRFVEGAHAVVVVLAKAIVFERLPRHVDFVIVVLCVVLEGGRRFADDVGGVRFLVVVWNVVESEVREDGLN